MEGAVPLEDPLRQGDLLDGVWFPMLKQPLQSVTIDGANGVLVPAKEKWGLVVSQCCDNESGEYLAIAQVQTRAGLTDEQEAALMSYEPDPGDLRGYVVEDFRLEPLPPVLVPKPGAHYVALLTRVSAFWGDGCSTMRSLRRARMTAAGRRHLRLNLALLWSRTEDDDLAQLARQGIPGSFA